MRHGVATTDTPIPGTEEGRQKWGRAACTRVSELTKAMSFFFSVVGGGGLSCVPPCVHGQNLALVRRASPCCSATPRSLQTQTMKRQPCERKRETVYATCAAHPNGRRAKKKKIRPPSLPLPKRREVSPVPFTDTAAAFIAHTPPPPPAFPDRLTWGKTG